MDDKKTGIQSLTRYDENGNVIATTDAERQEAIQALRHSKVVFSPEALEDLKRMGLTTDEVEAMIAEMTGGKH